jgi:hypothetical protein
MPEVNPISSVRETLPGKDLSAINADLYSQNSSVSPPEEHLTISPENTKTLLDLFNKDVVTSSSARSSNQSDAVSEEQTLEEATANRSFLDRMLSWLPSKTKVDQPVQQPTIGSVESLKNEMISGTPVLEAPEGVFLNPKDVVRIPQVCGHQLNPDEPVTSAEISEVISQLSDKTIEEVMQIVIRGQLQMEQEFAEVSEQTFEKNKIYVKIHQKMADEIYEKLMTDLKWGERSKTVQRYAFYAVAIASIAGVFVGYAPLVGQFLGPAVESVFRFIAGPAFRYSSAIMMLFASGTTKYMTWQTNLDSGRHQEAKNTLANYDRRLEELRENIATLAEDDQKMKEQLLKEIKRLRKMFKIVNRK